MNSLILTKKNLVTETEVILSNVKRALEEKIEGRGIVLNDLYLQSASNINVYLEFIPINQESMEADNYGLHLNVIYDWVISDSGTGSLNIEFSILRTDGETLMEPKEISFSLPTDGTEYIPQVIKIVENELNQMDIVCFELLSKQPG